MDELILGGKKYVSAKSAAKQTGYTKDYVGQLCRAHKLPAQMVGRNWYIEEEVLLNQKKSTLRSLETSGTGSVAVASTQSKDSDRHNVYESTEDTPNEERIVLRDIIPPREVTERPKINHDVVRPSRHQHHVVADAFPLRYEIDERPLMPTPVRTPRSTIHVELDDEDPKAHTRPRGGGKSVESVFRPSSHIADARAERIRRYGIPGWNTFEREETWPVAEYDEHTEDSDISLKRDIPSGSSISVSLLAALLVSALVIAGVLYASLFVVEESTYERLEEGVYKLQMKEFDLF